MLIVCNGLKRSGSTLQYNWVKSIITRGARPQDISGLKIINNKITFNKLIKWIESEKLYLLKTHHYLGVVKPKNVKICYIYRDLRDIALSLRAMKRNISDDEILNEISEIVKVSDKIEKIDDLFVQKYENIMRHGQTSIEELSSHLKIYLPEDEINRILFKYSVFNVEKRLDSFKKEHRYKTVLNECISNTPTAIKHIGKKLHLNVLIRKYFIKTNIFNEDHFLVKHISSNKGKIELWKSCHDDKLIMKISIEYKGWLIKHGYDI